MDGSIDHGRPAISVIPESVAGMMPNNNLSEGRVTVFQYISDEKYLAVAKANPERDVDVSMAQMVCDYDIELVTVHYLMITLRIIDLHDNITS